MTSKLPTRLVILALLAASGLPIRAVRAEPPTVEAVERHLAPLQARGLGWERLEADALGQAVLIDRPSFTPKPPHPVEGLRSLLAERATIRAAAPAAPAGLVDVTLESGALLSDDGTVTARRVELEQLDLARLEQLAAMPEPTPEQLDGLFRGFVLDGAVLVADDQKILVERLASRPRSAESGCAAGLEVRVEGLEVPDVALPDGRTESMRGDGDFSSCLDTAGKGDTVLQLSIANLASVAIELAGTSIRVPERTDAESLETALTDARLVSARIVLQDRGRMVELLDALAAGMGLERPMMGQMMLAMIGMSGVGPVTDPASQQAVNGFFAQPERLEIQVEPVGEPQPLRSYLESGKPPRLKITFR